MNERVYGNRLRVLTNPANLTTGESKAVQWEHLGATCERTPDRSWVNEAEARRVVAVVNEIRAANGVKSIGVVSPYAAQRKLIHDLLGAAPEVQVGTVHAFQGGERDVIVLSPTLSQGNSPGSVRWLAGHQNLWNVAFTRAVSRLVVVGDADLWRRTRGLLRTLLAQAEDAEARITSDCDMDEPLAKLHQHLLVAGIQVEVGTEIGGHRADLLIHSPNGPVALLLDRSGTRTDSTGKLGRNLRQLCTVQQLMTQASSTQVVRVPLWRCLSEPDAVLNDLGY